MAVNRNHPLQFQDLPKRIRAYVTIQARTIPYLGDGCWVWTGYVDRRGVPRVSYGGISRASRRVVFEFLTNTRLASTEPLTPVCGNKLCVNPRHQTMAVQRNTKPTTTPRFGQAGHICALFGGEHILAKLLGVHPSTCYRWSYPPPHGTDGLIPTRRVSPIKSAARLHGVLLDESDWDPRPFNP